MRESLIPKIPSSFIVSSVRYFFASRLISLGNLNSAEYSTVSYTVSVPINVSSWSTKPDTFLKSSSSTSRPFTSVVPETAPRLLLRARMSRNVDLPAPDAPMIASSWPGRAHPETSSRIVRPPSVYEMFEKCSEAGTWSVMSFADSFSGRRMPPKSLECVRPAYQRTGGRIVIVS